MGIKNNLIFDSFEKSYFPFLVSFDAKFIFLIGIFIAAIVLGILILRNNSSKKKNKTNKSQKTVDQSRAKTREILANFPLEISKTSFKNSIKGYNKQDVNVFIDDISKRINHAYQENVVLEAKYRQIEKEGRRKGLITDVLEKTLENVKISSKEMIEVAEREATEIINLAEKEYNNKISEAQKQLNFSQKEADKIMNKSKEKSEEIMKNYRVMYKDIIDKAKTNYESSKISARMIIENSNKQVGSIIEEANSKVNEIIEKGKVEAMDINVEFNKISNKAEESKKECLKLIKEQLELLESLEKEDYFQETANEKKTEIDKVEAKRVTLKRNDSNINATKKLQRYNISNNRPIVNKVKKVDEIDLNEDMDSKVL